MAKQKLTRKLVESALSVDQIVVRKGVCTVRYGFFYRLDKSVEWLVARVKQGFPHATIVDSGEVYKAFVGGAPIAKQSHWFVRFTL